MTRQQQILEFYSCPAAMTSGGEYAALFEALPGDVTALAHVAQGLLLHEHLATHAYGVTLLDERRSEVHIRPVAQMLARLLSQDDQPLSTARPVEARLIGNCRHFSVLMAAMLRAKGVPARPGAVSALILSLATLWTIGSANIGRPQQPAGFASMLRSTKYNKPY